MPPEHLIAVSSCPLVRPCTDAVLHALAERGVAVRVYETDGRGGRELEADVLAACVTAVRQLRESGWLSEHDEVVVLNTGAGLIYPDTVPAHVPVLPPSGSIPVPD